MKKNLIIAVIIIFILGVVLFLFLRPTDTLSEETETTTGETFTVEADEGTIQLEINEESLPEDVSREDIKVTKISGQEFFESDEPDESVIAYKLEPEGIEFEQPVTVTITGPITDTTTIPILFHKSTDTFVAVEDTEVDFDSESGTVTISGDISHFSSIGTDLKNSLFSAVVTPASGEYDLEETIPYAINIQHRQPYMSGKREISVGIGTTIYVNPKTYRREAMLTTSGKISPTEVLLETESFGEEQGYTFEQTFTCVEEGSDTVIIVGGITIDYTLEILSEYPNGMSKVERQNVRTTITDIDHPDYKCNEPAMMYMIDAPILCDPTGENTNLPACP